MKNLRVRWTALLIIVCSIVGVSVSAYRSKAATGASVPQDTINLERRVGTLEQRLYSIENSINRLEQQSSLSTRTAPSTSQRDLEVELLQRRIEMLQEQISEIQCGLAKLDERTLPATVRDARKRSGGLGTEPCRLNSDMPLQLSTRP